MEKLDPSTMLIRLGGYGNVPTNPGIDVKPLFVAPRIGLAWRVTDNTVFRTGYGITKIRCRFPGRCRASIHSRLQATLWERISLNRSAHSVKAFRRLLRPT